jgi:hypothetical protein
LIQKIGIDLLKLRDCLRGKLQDAVGNRITLKPHHRLRKNGIGDFQSPLILAQLETASPGNRITA